MGWVTRGEPLFYRFWKRPPEALRQSQPSALIYPPRHEWTGDPGPLCRSGSSLSLRPAWCGRPELRPWRWGAAGGGGEEHRKRRRRTRGCRAGRRHLRRRYRGDRDASRISASVGPAPPRECWPSPIGCPRGVGLGLLLLRPVAPVIETVSGPPQGDIYG